MTFRLSILCVVFALAVACSHGTGSPSAEGLTPTGPSAVTAAATTPLSAAAQSAQAPGRQDVVVNMADACDPDTFNAVVGPGTCVRSGGMKFDLFIQTLTRLAVVGAWHFAPTVANLRVGQELMAVNRGGEVHTFTEVAQFGGGSVANLNQLAHTPDVAPECAHLEQDDFVAPGASYREEVGHGGALKFQCCIHPWMRLEAQASTR